MRQCKRDMTECIIKQPEMRYAMPWTSRWLSFLIVHA